MSERNGDRSRFGRERRKKIFRRKRNKELCQAQKKEIRPQASA